MSFVIQGECPLLIPFILSDASQVPISPDLGSVIPLNAARTPIDILMGPAISLS